MKIYSYEVVKEIGLERGGLDKVVAYASVELIKLSRIHNENGVPL